MMKAYIKLCLLVGVPLFLLVWVLPSVALAASGEPFGVRESASGVLWLILFLIALGLYMLPYFIARSRNHRNATALGILNFFLGWTFLGWLGALIWAVANGPDAGNGKVKLVT